MLERVRRLPTPAFVISVIALIVAVGGGTYALAALNRGKVKNISRRQANQQIRKKAPGLSVLHAQSADTATNAGNAINLDGKPASDYRLHCPGNLDRAGDLCFEVDLRPAALYPDALKACALDQRRLPNDGELALVYDHLSASQPYEWTVGRFTDNGASLATVLGQNSSRQLLPTANTTNTATVFRCVTTVTN